MDDRHTKFSKKQVPTPPADLTQKIIARVVARERRILKVKIGVSATIFVASVSAAIVACKDLITALSHAGFFSLAALAFSDFSTVMSNFPDFAFSMIETIPVFTVALLLSGIMFAIWSVAAFVDEASLLRGNRFPALK